MLCPNCNTECQESWTFCPGCSKPLPKPEVIQPPSPSTPSTLDNHPPYNYGAITGKFIWMKWILLVVFILVIPGFFMFQSWNTSQKEQAVIAQARTYLSEGYNENLDLTKTSWGRIDEAKTILTALSPQSSVKKDADVLLQEIAEREIGKNIGEALLNIASKDPTDRDISKLRNAKSLLTWIDPKSRYYQQSQVALPRLNEVLDGLLIARVRQNIADSEFGLAGANLVDISSNGKYEDSRTQLRDQIIARDDAIKRVTNHKARLDYAEGLEKIFLDQGMDVYVSTSGSQNEYLRLKYILWSRPLVLKAANDGGILDKARDLGFKTVVFDTGYGTWRYDL